MTTGPPQEAVWASTTPVGLECREPGQTWLLVGLQGQGQEGRRLSLVPGNQGPKSGGAGSGWKAGLSPAFPAPPPRHPAEMLPSRLCGGYCVLRAREVGCACPGGG